jgi:hypothetical protein
MKIVITESQYQFLVENSDDIDQILDKINNSGYENLSNDEKNTLKMYSEWLNSGKKGDFSTKNDDNFDEYDENTGEEFTTTLKDGSDFSFRYDYKEELPGENQYYGSVKWKGEEWVGLIVTDDTNKITEIDFFLLDVDDLHSVESNELRLQEELGRLLPQVMYFLDDEVIPNL